MRIESELVIHPEFKSEHQVEARVSFDANVAPHEDFSEEAIVVRLDRAKLIAIVEHFDALLARMERAREVLVAADFLQNK